MSLNNEHAAALRREAQQRIPELAAPCILDARVTAALARPEGVAERRGE